uniref:DB domain-containing protein n=1 Tax=Panagrellus redivivus TaxID=6233 RepID=A0A7E4WC78_PANRE
MTLCRVAVLAVVVLCAFEVSNACFASGVCGGQPSCGAPPPPPPVCGGGCQQGYQCGSYGCYRTRRARARASNTIAVGDENTAVSAPQHPQLFGSARFNALSRPTVSPNEAFMRCCESRNLPDACMHKCNFNTYTKESLMAMYFRTDACPIQAAAEIQFCAAQGRDHSQCCARNGVANTVAGPKCLTFCDQRPGNVTQLDFSYVSCYDRFEQMKACFWHGANGAY